MQELVRSGVQTQLMPACNSHTSLLPRNGTQLRAQLKAAFPALLAPGLVSERKRKVLVGLQEAKCSEMVWKGSGSLVTMEVPHGPSVLFFQPFLV